MPTPKVKTRRLLLPKHLIQSALDGRLTEHRVPVEPQPKQRDDGVWMRRTGRNTWAMNLRRRDTHAKDGALLGSEEYQLPVDEWLMEFCPTPVGTRLWVAERWAETNDYDGQVLLDGRTALYFADDEKCIVPERWRPSTTMPQWASRLRFEVTAVRIERLRDISEDSARAEGAKPYHCPQADALMNAVGGGMKPIPYTSGFANMWNEHNKKVGGAWHDNPWVWVYTLNRVEAER